MVKLEDGSMIFAGQLLAGEGEDDDGHSLKFKNKDDGAYYNAEAPMRDGSGRKKIYSFDLGTTQVRVSVSTVEPEPEEKEKEKKEKEEDEGEETKSKKLEENVNLKPATEAKVIRTSGKKG